jgi:hypothetical protein
MVELVEHRWNKKEKRMEGLMVAARFDEILEGLGGIEFSQRLYTVSELKEIYTSVGMDLVRTYHGNGRARDPGLSQFEIFVESRRRGT